MCCVSCATNGNSVSPVGLIRSALSLSLCGVGCDTHTGRYIYMTIDSGFTSHNELGRDAVRMVDGLSRCFNTNVTLSQTEVKRETSNMVYVRPLFLVGSFIKGSQTTNL